jgi:hypothetical protein
VSIPNAAKFWPGLIDVTTTGTWHLDITLGSDHMCVSVAFKV